MAISGDRAHATPYAQAYDFITGMWLLEGKALPRDHAEREEVLEAAAQWARLYVEMSIRR